VLGRDVLRVVDEDERAVDGEVFELDARGVADEDVGGLEPWHDVLAAAFEEEGVVAAGGGGAKGVGPLGKIFAFENERVGFDDDEGVPASAVQQIGDAASEHRQRGEAVMPGGSVEDDLAAGGNLRRTRSGEQVVHLDVSCDPILATRADALGEEFFAHVLAGEAHVVGGAEGAGGNALVGETVTRVDEAGKREVGAEVKVGQVLRGDDDMRAKTREFTGVGRGETVMPAFESGDGRSEDRLVKSVPVVDADPHGAGAKELRSDNRQVTLPMVTRWGNVQRP